MKRMAFDDQEIPDGEHPVGKGSKNATLMVLCTHIPGEARQQTRRMNTSLTHSWLGRNSSGDLWRPAARTEKALEAPTHKPAGAAQTLHTFEQGYTKTRLDFALVNEAFRAAVGDFEVVQRNLVPNTKGSRSL